MSDLGSKNSGGSHSFVKEQALVILLTEGSPPFCLAMESLDALGQCRDSSVVLCYVFCMTSLLATLSQTDINLITA